MDDTFTAALADRGKCWLTEIEIGGMSHKTGSQTEV